MNEDAWFPLKDLPLGVPVLQFENRCFKGLSHIYSILETNCNIYLGILGRRIKLTFLLFALLQKLNIFSSVYKADYRLKSWYCISYKMQLPFRSTVFIRIHFGQICLGNTTTNTFLCSPFTVLTVTRLYVYDVKW
jgi:hypothetical protein